MNDDRSRDGPTQRRFIRFVPLPQRSQGFRAGEGLRQFQGALSRLRRTCPNDGNFLRVENVIDAEADYVQTNDGETRPVALAPDPALVCPKCGFTLRVDTLIAEAQADASNMKHAENQLMIMGFVLGLGCAVVAFLTANLFLLIGGGLFAMTLFVRAFLLRYRHWQAIHSRMFEAQPPLRDWLRYELRS